MINIPKVSLAAENKVQQYTKYPVLSLEHGERALILCIEPEPEVEFKHVLQAPEIGPDGLVITEEARTQKGDTYERTVTELIGQHLCFGDYETVLAKGVDPDNCPTCRAAEEEQGIAAPVQHYAMHVIKYSLKPGGWTPRDPFGVEVVAWRFPVSKFNLLVDLAEEWGSLQEHDLKLGPCENKKYQKFDINVSAKAEWQKSDERKQAVLEAYKNNRSENLAEQIAPRISKADALKDIQRVLDRHAQISNPNKTSVAVQNPFESTKSESTEAVNGVDDSGDDSESRVTSLDFDELMKGL